MTKKHKRVLIELLIFACVAFVFLRIFERRQVFQPSTRFNGRPEELGRNFEDVFIPVEKGQSINAWFIPGGAATNAAHHPIFLVCHGNAGNIGDRIDLAQSLLEAGGGVLLFDYRGYGKSVGRPSEEGTYRDAQAAYHWLREKGIAPTNIIAYGESLGGGIATELALREPVGGLILQSAFTSIPDVGAELFPFLPVRLVGAIHYDNRAKLPRIHVPVLILHSTNDDFISFRHAERNFAAANEPKFLCQLYGGHQDTLGRSEPAALSALKQFVALLSKGNSYHVCTDSASKIFLTISP